MPSAVGERRVGEPRLERGEQAAQRHGLRRLAPAAEHA